MRSASSTMPWARFPELRARARLSCSAISAAARCRLSSRRMARIAGTVLVLYATLLAPLIPDAAAHFVIASVLGAPAAILVSLIMVPETSDKRTGGSLEDPRVARDPDMHAIVK